MTVLLLGLAGCVEGAHSGERWRKTRWAFSHVISGDHSVSVVWWLARWGFVGLLSFGFVEEGGGREG